MNLYHGLLFNSGHISDVKLARQLAGEPAATVGEGSSVASPGPSVRAIAARRLARVTGFIEAVRWLGEELVLLGGRPVKADHLDDLDEPFPPLHGSR